MSSTALCPFQPTHQFDAPDEAFLRCLLSLRRGDAGAGQPSEKRGAERLCFYGNPIVVLETRPQSAGNMPRIISFRVWGRDLSRGGLSFLFSGEVLPLHTEDDAIPLQATSLLSQSQELTCGLARPDGSVLWLQAQVLRVRPVHEGLMECGVHFLGRQEGPPGDPK